MPFRRKKSDEHRAAAPFPGAVTAFGGLSASYYAARRACTVTAHATATSAPARDVGWHTALSDELASWKPAPSAPVSKAMIDGKSLGGFAVGAAAAGLRAAVFTDDTSVCEMRDALRSSVRARLPFVVHHASACSVARASASAHQGVAEAVAETGAFALHARDVQEVADFTLIAHRIAEMALCPGVCVQDGLATGHAVQTVGLPTSDLIEAYLGFPNDTIDAPSLAQEVLFGKQRRRIPKLINTDRPIGVDVPLDGNSLRKAAAAHRPFFVDGFSDTVDAAMNAFAVLTGRSYARVKAYRTEDADFVVVVKGAVGRSLEAVVDFLRKREGRKVGVISVILSRPFPRDLVGQLLKGKRAFTVLEDVDPASEEDLPLAKDIRGADVLAPGMDPPERYAGLYSSASGPPSFADLCAVFRNMSPESQGKRFFHLGVRLNPKNIRLPKLERLQQSLGAEYPDLEQSGLFAPGGELEFSREDGGAIRVITTSSDGGHSFGKLLARTMFTVPGTFVWAAPDAVSGRRERSFSYTITHAPQSFAPSLPEQTDALVLSSPALLTPSSAMSAMDRGVIVVNAVHSGEDVWRSLGSATRVLIAEKKAQVFLVDADGIARDITGDTHAVAQASLFVLAGAVARVYPRAGEDTVQQIAANLEKQFGDRAGAEKAISSTLLRLLSSGSEHVKEIDWSSFPPVHDEPVREREPAWTVRRARQVDGSLFDLGRFWDSVGYLYETGREAMTLADPYLATGTVPAGSSAFRNAVSPRNQIPRLIPENCTACGVCLMHCPHSAMPAGIQSIEDVFDNALRQCESAGKEIFQLQRITRHIVGKAHTLLATDDLHAYRDLDDLLSSAFRQVIDRLDPPDKQRAELVVSFDNILDVVTGFPVVRSETFFDGPNRLDAGSGKAFTIAIDPDACVDCGLCVAECPEGALEMIDREPDRLDQGRRNRAFLFGLPDVQQSEIDRFQSDESSPVQAFHLLNRRAYYATLGGDDAERGSGIKNALHLYAACVETRLQPLRAQFAEKLSFLKTRIDERIRELVEGDTRIHDLDAFTRQLAQLQSDTLDRAHISGLLEEVEGQKSLDGDLLSRLAISTQQVGELAERFNGSNEGNRLATMVAAIGSGSGLSTAATYPYNPYMFPWLNQAPGDVAGAAAGLFEGVSADMARCFQIARTAELVLDETYDPSRHDEFFRTFSWVDFTDEEKALCPIITATVEKWNPGLARILDESLPIKVLLVETLDDTAAVLAGAAGNSVRGARSDLAIASLAYQRAFVLQTSVGKPAHFMSGILDGLDFNGPALFRVYAAEPSQSGIPTEQSATHARLAVYCRAIPLIRCDPRRGEELHERLDLSDNPNVDLDWALSDLPRAVSGNQPGGAGGRATAITFAAWAARDRRFAEHFEPVPERDWRVGMISVDRFLGLSEDERSDAEPYVELVDTPGGGVVRLLVSREMVQATREHLENWRRLLELGGVRSTLADTMATKANELARQELETHKADVEAAYNARASELASERAQRVHAMLTQRLLSLSGFGEGSPRHQLPLRDFKAAPSIDEIEG